MVLFLLVKLKRAVNPRPRPQYPSEYPTVTLLIACFNEVDFMPQKVGNCLSLTYPKDKLRILFVTDGSNDGTAEYLKSQIGIDVMHRAERAGKIGAMNRGMTSVLSELTIFTDANTLLNPEALINIVRHFTSDSNVGCVAGEKQLLLSDAENASGAGEGFYWKYESALKKWDSEIGSVVGAAGELFAVRTALFEPVEKDTLLDDFMISMRLAGKGYRVVYEPEAIAFEKPTTDVKEEMKRKVRICAGGIQSIIRLSYILNPFKYGLLCFQYVSHRVLRWSITPIAMAIAIPLNCYLAWNLQGIYTQLFYAQLVFYVFSAFGGLLAQKKIKIKLLFIPYFFTMQNIAVFQGMKRYFGGRQSVLWEKAKRAE